MVFDRFRKKSGQPRSPDGKFSNPDGGTSGAARVVRNDMTAVAETLKSAFDLTNTIQDQALKNMEMKTRYRDMIDDLEGDIENPDGDMDFEQMALKVILQAMQSDKTAQAPGDPWGQGGFQEGPPPAVPQVPPPTPEAGGVDRLNQVLGALNKIPDKVVSEKAIDVICEHEGIDKGELKGVIKKLAPVIQ